MTRPPRQRRRTPKQARSTGPAPAGAPPTHHLLRLQQRLGNQSVARLVQRQNDAALAIPAQPPLLRFGSAGTFVSLLQQLLNGTGVALDVDGAFGPLTHQAVQRFQMDRDLQVDGIVGQETWGALRSAETGEQPGSEPPADDQPAHLVDQPGGAPPDKAAILLLRSLLEGDILDPAMIVQVLAGALGLPPDRIPDIPALPLGDRQSTILTALHALQGEVARLVQEGALPPATLQRATLLLTFLGEQAAAGVATPQEALDPARAAAVAAAMSQVGRVQERGTEGNEFDEKKQRDRPVRLGWRHLDDYFTTAYEGKSAQDGAGYGPGLQEQVRFFDRPLQQDWCGIFALWALKTAGVPMSKWRISQGPATWQLQPPGYRPQPGDVAYFHSFQTLNRHMAIIARIEGDLIHTIDGNIGAPGEIAPRVRSISASGVQYLKPDAFS